MTLDRLLIVSACLVAAGVAAPLMAPDLLAALTRTQPEFAPEETGHSPDPRPAAYARTATLRADERGHFETNAVINGRSVPVMVDTGATTIAIPSETARRLGVLPAQSEFVIPIETANGTIKAAPAVLSEVSVSGVTVRNVEAVVVPGSALSVSLLGMTFLSRLQKFEIARGQLVLTE